MITQRKAVTIEQRMLQMRCLATVLPLSDMHTPEYLDLRYTHSWQHSNVATALRVDENIYIKAA